VSALTKTALERPRQSVTDTLAASCAVVFIIILAIAAYWDPAIRVLHVFEAVPYAAAAALVLRQRKFGYALGAASGAFWLWTAGTLTTFVRNGFERLGMLLRTGRVDRPDVLIAAPAACATAGLVIFCVWGYLRLRNRSWSDVALFVGTLVLVAGFFIVIFAAFAPQFLGMFKRLVGS
jgi:hypothetical protein